MPRGGDARILHDMDAVAGAGHPPPMRATLLGTGTSTGIPGIACDCPVCTSHDPRDKRLRTSCLLQWDDGTNLLIDASIDCRQQLLGVGLKSLDGVLLTHGHADHCLGLDELRIFNFRQRRAMPVHGNAETLRQIRRTFWYVFEKTQYEEGKPKLDLIEVEREFVAAGRVVTALPVMHGSLEILGYRLGSFAYVTDALRVPEETSALMRGLDVLVINALREHEHPTHQTLSAAVSVIEHVRPQRAFITHVGHWLTAADIDARTPENVLSAYDGMTFDFDDGP